MRIRIFSTPRSAARALARTVADAVLQHPRLVIGLPTGRTPIQLYDELVQQFRDGTIDFARATTFNLDEFVGIPSTHPGSYRRFMQERLFDSINLPPRQINFLNGMARDLEEECRRYERAIARAGGIDLQILGLGANGHIGFNEPAASLFAETHVARLTTITRRANRALFDNKASRVPRAALSMGMATILQARRIVLLATGREKARCVADMANGCVTPKVPASFLQLHRRCEVWLDRAAASRL